MLPKLQTLTPPAVGFWERGHDDAAPRLGMTSSAEHT